MTPEQLIEAILFVSDAPVTAEEIAEVLELPVDGVDASIQQLVATYADERGLELRPVAGGWRLFTKPEAQPDLERFASTDRSRRLMA